MGKLEKRLSSSQMIILGFAVVILLGSMLLMLPVSSKSGTFSPFLDCLLTSTSAVCVTGLVVYDTAVHWTLFGQTVILILIQIGGMGVITVAAALSLAAGRKIGDITVILILGMMLGAGIDAAVQILQYLSDEQSLKTYIVWTMGSLGNVSGLQLLILAAAVLAGLMLAAFSCKSLNLLPAGEEYAVSAGTDIGRTRTLIFISTVLLSGTATAFCGPLGFIGLAVPHIVRLVTGTADHRILVPGTALCGGIIMICCDMVTKLTAVPVNAVTSLIGIPVVIRVVIKYRKYA